MKQKLLTLALVAGLVLSSFSASFAANSPTNSREKEGHDDSSTSSSNVTTTSGGSMSNGTTNVFTNEDGDQVSKIVYSQNGITMTVTTNSSDNATVREADYMGNGTTHVLLRTTEGGPDVTPNGQPVLKYAVLVISENGAAVGCFVDPTTGLPYATGADAVYYAYDANGNLVAHYVNAQGYFYTGTHVINGQTIIFNDEGVIVG